MKKNFLNLLKKYKNKTNKKNKLQKGGVGFASDISSCKIGGLPEIIPTSDCPSGFGPSSKDFAQALYGDSLTSKKSQLGGKKKKEKKYKRKKRKLSTKRKKSKLSNKSKKSKRKT